MKKILYWQIFKWQKDFKKWKECMKRNVMNEMSGSLHLLLLVVPRAWRALLTEPRRGLVWGRGGITWLAVVVTKDPTVRICWWSSKWPHLTGLMQSSKPHSLLKPHNLILVNERQKNHAKETGLIWSERVPLPFWAKNKYWNAVF